MAAIDCSEQPYIVLIFLYAGPSGILDSDGSKENTALLGGVRIVALSISSHEQTQKSRVCCVLKL